MHSVHLTDCITIPSASEFIYDAYLPILDKNRQIMAEILSLHELGKK